MISCLLDCTYTAISLFLSWFFTAHLCSIPCACGCVDIGETGRTLKQRIMDTNKQSKSRQEQWHKSTCTVKQAWNHLGRGNCTMHGTTLDQEKNKRNTPYQSQHTQHEFRQWYDHWLRLGHNLIYKQSPNHHPLQTYQHYHFSLVRSPSLVSFGTAEEGLRTETSWIILLLLLRSIAE